MITAHDEYPRYFAEKLWEWLPEIYRELDQKEGGNALRAFLEAFAEQAALLKRSQDRLWDDAFVELASDWAIPYIGGLVGTRLVSSLNPRARRADVAKTIYYRRRKGTLAVLEQLIADMAEWDGKVVESFRRLGRMRHGLDGLAHEGRVTGTPEGGLANLRAVRGAKLAGDPFDEFHYTPDMRRPKGRTGLQGITKLNFHLCTLQAVEFKGVKPRRMKKLSGNHQGFTFDPSGRDVALFAPNQPDRDWSAWQSADEWNLPRAITCCLLADARYRITEKVIDWILNEGSDGASIPSSALRKAAEEDLLSLQGQTFTSAAQLHHVLGGRPSSATLTTPGVFAGLLLHALVDDCGSSALLPDSSTDGAAIGISFKDLPVLPRHHILAGRLDTWSFTVPSGIDCVIHPERGRCLIDPGASPISEIRVRYHAGMLAPIGAGAFDREVQNLQGDTPIKWQAGKPDPGTPGKGTVEVVDSGTYTNPPDQMHLEACCVRASEGQRPYLKLNNFWRFGASINNATLNLDGLWIGTRTTPRSVVLQAKDASSNFEKAILRYCTLDPGGEDANGAALPPVNLVISCYVEELVIDRCVLASIQLQGSDAGVDRLIVRDSIIHTRTAGQVPIEVPTAHLTLERCTVVAPQLTSIAIEVERVDACDSLIVGRLQVSDTQKGCFRFSARELLSSVPCPYRSVVVQDPARLFASRRFGDPEYLRLSHAAPVEILRGAEHGRSMGAHCIAALPIKEESLMAKIEEYMPFGRLPHLVFEN